MFILEFVPIPYCCKVLSRTDRTERSGIPSETFWCAIRLPDTLELFHRRHREVAMHLCPILLLFKAWFLPFQVIRDTYSLWFPIFPPPPLCRLIPRLQCFQLGGRLFDCLQGCLSRYYRRDIMPGERLRYPVPPCSVSSSPLCNWVRPHPTPPTPTLCCGWELIWPLTISGGAYVSTRFALPKSYPMFAGSPTRFILILILSLISFLRCSH